MEAAAHQRQLEMEAAAHQRQLEMEIAKKNTIEAEIRREERRQAAAEAEEKAAVAKERAAIAWATRVESVLQQIKMEQERDPVEAERIRRCAGSVQNVSSCASHRRQNSLIGYVLTDLVSQINT